eukprot:14137281-Heterocapsa_arctica.AAC.1
MVLALGPAEDVFGSLVGCPIDHDAREHVMGEMMVAKQSEGGLPERYKTAVESRDGSLLQGRFREHLLVRLEDARADQEVRRPGRAIRRAALVGRRA